MDSNRSQVRAKEKEHGTKNKNSRTNLLRNQLDSRCHPLSSHNNPSSNSNRARNNNLSRENLPINRSNNYAFNNSNNSSRNRLQDLVNNRVLRRRLNNLSKENSPTNKSSSSARSNNPSRLQLNRMIHLRHIRRTHPLPRMPPHSNGSRMTSTGLKSTSRRFILLPCCLC